MERHSRKVLEVFWEGFGDFFRKCSGRSPNHFPGLPEGFGGLLGKMGLGSGVGLGDCLMRIPIQTPDQRPGRPLLVNMWRLAVSQKKSGALGLAVRNGYYKYH